MKPDSEGTQSSFKQALSATMRALARSKDVPSTPVIPSQLHKADIAGIRGIADNNALYFRLHDAQQHYVIRPTQPASARLFDMLENVRVEALGSQNMTGVQHNLAKRFEKECIEHQITTENISLPTIVELLSRVHIANQAAPGNLQEIAAFPHDELKKLLPLLDSMKAQIGAQTDYAKIALKLIEELAYIRQSIDSEEKENATPAPDDQPNTSDEQQKEASDFTMELLTQDGSSQPGMVPMPVDDTPVQESEETTVEEDDSRSSSPYPWNDDRHDLRKIYHAFTTKYDETVPANALATTTELETLRAQLDQRLSQFQSVTARLANRLQRLLLARQARRWIFDEEDGMIDSRKLSRLIIHPDYEYIYKREEDSEFRDTVVSLLIDNSGSMRGRPITMAALSADIIARTLDRCGVKTEILGFTTKEWKGGKSQKAWNDDDKPSHPGRLNDLRHIIYKPADVSWRKAKKNLGLMLKDGILKENIDGEAILWACDRLLSRPEQRRILMVISDGAPVDDSTLSANSGNYLDKHLRKVIELVETKMPIELTAIGIGHDVTRYYKNAVTITELDKLGETMTEQLTQLFSKKGN